MSRFKAAVKPKVGSRKTVNDAGSEAYDRDARTALASLTLTSMVKDTFYESEAEQLGNVRSILRDLAEANDLKFAAKAAVYARHEHGLRSITHVVAGEVAQLRGEFENQRGAWGPEFFRRVVHRMDDMSEIAGYWIQTYGTGGDKKTLPNAMKRGFASVLANSPPGALAKWDGAATRALTLRQLAHLCHPRGGATSTVYKLRAGKLDAADTHEVALTRAGQGEDDVDTAKAVAWADLFNRGKVRYLAALRNARRIIEDAPGSVNDLCTKLTSLEDIRGSKVLPFQFLAAHDAVAAMNGPHVRKVLNAIEEGATLALSNVPKLEGSTLVCLDDSGSMRGATGQGVHLNARGEVDGVPRHKSPAVMGAMFVTALMLKNDDCDAMLFDEDARYFTFAGSSLFGGMAQLLAKINPKGTNFHAPFQTANRAYDRIILLSDAQGWMGETCPDKAVREYEKRLSCKPHIYSWDLVGSTTSQFPAPRIHALAGISDRVFDLMRALESDPKAMVNAIDAINIGE